MNGGPFELIHVSLDRKLLQVPTDQPPAKHATSLASNEKMARSSS
jgi:hypothetical protein